MNYVCGPIILYSFDKTRMLDFLSDVFEFEIDLINDRVLFGELTLKIKELPNQERSLGDHRIQNQCIEFEFNLSSIEDLEEIISKFNFFHYRKNDQAQTQIMEELIVSFDHKDSRSLLIRDIDGRNWTFNFKEVQSDFGFLDELLPLKDVETNDFN